MKESIENSIKNSLENYELPYNADAWKAMSARLDVVKPVAKPHFKWYIAASAIVVASACGYLYYSNGNSTSEQNDRKELAQEKNTPTTTNNNSESSNEQKHSNPTFTTDLVDHTADLDKNESAQLNSPNDNSIVNDVAQNNVNRDTDKKGGDDNKQQQEDDKKSDGTADKSNNEGTDNTNQDVFTFQMPAITTKCENEKLVVNNQNAVELKIIYPNGITWVAKPNSNTAIQLTQAGTYIVGYDNESTFVKEGTFQVMAGPSTDFDIVNVEDKYDEKGLPATNVVANGIGGSYKWEFDNATAEGKEVIGHFFKQGEHKITLTVTGSNGCTNASFKKVNVEDNYNLMAVNSFVPTDIDPANNTFMPYSLKVRGDLFHMIILDPTDGHLVYETNDASKGWDGNDKQTGAMVKLETAYIWKVTIQNPMTGESPEYAGTVTPISRRR